MDPFSKMRRAVGRAIPNLNGWLEHPAGKEGEHYLKSGDFAAAEGCFQKALLDINGEGPVRSRSVKLMLSLGTAQQRQGKLEEAAETVERAREALELAGARDTLEMASALELRASIDLDQDRGERAAELIESAIEIQQRVAAGDREALAQRFRRLAVAYGRAGRSVDQRAALQEALSNTGQAFGAGHRNTADCLVDLADFEQNTGNYSVAIGYLRRAVDIHREACGIESEEVARDYQMLASAYQFQGDLENSVTYYEKALRLRERQLGGSTAELGILLMSLAEAYNAMNRPAPAMELLQQAVGRLEGAHDHRLPLALHSLGAAYMQCGRFQDAAQALSRARDLWEEAPEPHQEALQANSALMEAIEPYLPVQQDAGTPVMETPDFSDLPPMPAMPPKYTAPGMAPPPPTAKPAAPQPPPAMVRDPNADLTALRAAVHAQAQAFQQMASFPAPPPQAATPQFGGNVQFDFVRPDGSPLERPFTGESSAPVRLTLVLPDSAPSQNHTVLVPASAPAPAPQPAGFHGWDDLAFEFLEAGPASRRKDAGKGRGIRA